jgi:hypothetical protein
MTANTTQAAFLGRLQGQLSAARLAPYLRAASGDMSLAIARYYWNAELCQACYPVLQAVEIALRNNLDRALSAVFPVRGYAHIESWIDRVPRVVVHPGGEDAITRAKSKLLLWDARLGDFRRDGRKGRDDLVAAMSFGFWVGLLERAYDAPGMRGVFLWPDHKKVVFPGAGGVLMTSIRVTFGQLRQFRNRVFHHEPVWQKRETDPTPRERYDAVLQALRWLGGEQSQLPHRLHGVPEIFDGVAQIPLMHGRLLDTVDAILEQARLRKGESDARQTARSMSRKDEI